MQKRLRIAKTRSFWGLKNGFAYIQVQKNIKVSLLYISDFQD